jgi:hypothetical protein
MTAILKVDTIQDTAGNNIINEASDVITIGASGDTIALAGTTVTGITQGITEADMWRLSANITGDYEPLTSNLERVDNATFAKIGTGMSVSSGIWSFPITGLYQITFIWSIQATSIADNSMNGIIQGSSNNFTASDDLAQLKLAADTSDNKSQAATISAFFNCTNVSTHKIRFNINSMSSNTTRGNSGINQTGFVFIRLGDSQ